MLKIDLLPKHVRERRAVRGYLIGSGLGLGAVAATMLFLYIARQNVLADKKEILSVATQRQTEVQKIRSDRDAAKAAAAPIMAMQTFFQETRAFGPAIDRMMKEIARYTYGKVRIFSITPTEGAAPATDPMGMGGMGMGGGMDMMGMGGGAMAGGGFPGGGGGFGGGAATGPDIKAVLLDCWTDDYVNIPKFLNNLKRSGTFSDVKQVSPPPFQLAPQEGGGEGGGGMGGGAEGMPAMMGGAMGGGFGGGSGGGTGNEGLQSNLMFSRNGVRFQVICTLAQPVKGPVVPGSAPAQDPNAMMGMGGMGMGPMMGSGGMAGMGEGMTGGGTPPGSEGAGGGATGGAAGDTGAGEEDAAGAGRLRNRMGGGTE